MQPISVPKENQAIVASPLDQSLAKYRSLLDIEIDHDVAAEHRIEWVVEWGIVHQCVHLRDLDDSRDFWGNGGNIAILADPWWRPTGKLAANRPARRKAQMRPFERNLVAIDGVHSHTGRIPSCREGCCSDAPCFDAGSASDARHNERSLWSWQQ